MKAAVILAGSGFLDGSEIRESVLSYLMLAQHNIEYYTFAPDLDIDEVVSHVSQKLSGQKRNILEESARIARGDILALDKLKESDYDMLVIPGGFGVAKHLCSYAVDGVKCSVLKEFEDAVLAFFNAKKPIVGICIAPMAIARVLSGKGSFKMTLGLNETFAAHLKELGMQPIMTEADEMVCDDTRPIYTCSGYVDEPTLDKIYTSLQKIFTEIMSKR